MNLPATWALRTCPCGLISKLTYSKASKKSSLRRYLIPSRLQPTCPVTWAVIAACSSLETDLIPYWRKTTNYTQAATGGKAVKAAALAGIFDKCKRKFIKCYLLHEKPINHPFIQSFVAHWSCFLIVAFKKWEFQNLAQEWENFQSRKICGRSKWMVPNTMIE